MKPEIIRTEFGSITINGETFEHDVIIRLNGKVKKRKKKLSKAVYGTSHTMSLAEARHVCEKGSKHLIIGTGQNGLLKLSKEAKEYFRKKKCKVDLMTTPEAVKTWNKAEDKVIGLFHITC